jgi:probable F420-dependent oxidoreductase
MAIDIGVFQINPDMRADPAIVAKAAEDLGFTSYWVPEHAILPVEFESTYVRDRTEEEPPPPPDYLWQVPDPWIALTRAATATTRIRVGSAICLIPEHNPLILGNEIASLDHYCGGRVNVGIGAGWNELESRILGVDFDHRWTQTRECVEVMKTLWTTEESEHHGKYYDFPPVRCFPKPTQKPHPPIYFGTGGSERVYKRIVEWGDGWIPLIEGPEDLAAGIKRINELCAEKGRDPKTVHHVPFGLENQFRTRAERDALEAAGAQGVLIWILSRDLDDVLEELKGLAGELIA